MRRIINTLCVLLTGALLLTSCQKEIVDRITLNATFSHYSGSDKLYVDANHYTHWSEDDPININGHDYSVKFRTTQNGTIALIDSVVRSQDNRYAAIYPYSFVTDESSVFYGATSVPVDLTDQNYTFDDGKQLIVSPMSAQVDADSSSTLQFTNLCSLVEVKVTAPTGVTLYLDSIRVTSSTDYLSGPATVNISDDTLIMATSGESLSHSVTMVFNEGEVSLTSDATGSYYVVVPPISGGNLTIDIYGHDGSNYYHYTKTKSDAALPASTIGPTPTLDTYTVAPWLGSGTESDPYQIGSLAQLQALRNNVNSGTTYSGVYFQLTADINCGNDSWTPIGTYAHRFQGIFDGNGNSVTYQISAGSADYQGLFGAINSATVKNLIVNGAISGSGNFYGGIAGLSTNSIIINSYSTVSVSSSWQYIGGITGSADGGTVSYCYASGTITHHLDSSDEYFAGGIDGKNNGNITHCTFTGAISPHLNATYKYVGMIAGESSTNNITDCYFVATDNDTWNDYRGIGTNVLSTYGYGTNGTSPTTSTYRLRDTTYGQNDPRPAGVVTYTQFYSIIDNLSSQYDVYKAALQQAFPH